MKTRLALIKVLRNGYYAVQKFIFNLSGGCAIFEKCEGEQKDNIVFDKYIPSYTHLVYKVSHKGKEGVFKTARARSFSSALQLRQEVLKLQRLREIGIRVPSIIHDASRSWINPYIISELIESESKLCWSQEVHRLSWLAESELIQSVQQKWQYTGLSVTSKEQYKNWILERLNKMDDMLKGSVVSQVVLHQALADVIGILDVTPWCIGFDQLPEMLFDGKQFWFIDWHSPNMIPQVKWISDYTIYEELKGETGLVKEHQNTLAQALGMDSSKNTYWHELYCWKKYCVLELIIHERRTVNNIAYQEELVRQYLL